MRDDVGGFMMYWRLRTGSVYQTSGMAFRGKNMSCGLFTKPYEHDWGRGDVDWDILKSSHWVWYPEVSAPQPPILRMRSSSWLLSSWSSSLSNMIKIFALYSVVKLWPDFINPYSYTTSYGDQIEHKSVNWVFYSIIRHPSIAAIPAVPVLITMQFNPNATQIASFQWYSKRHSHSESPRFHFRFSCLSWPRSSRPSLRCDPLDRLCLWLCDREDSLGSSSRLESWLRLRSGRPSNKGSSPTSTIRPVLSTTWVFPSAASRTSLPRLWQYHKTKRRTTSH